MRTLASGSANRWLFTDVTVVEGVETIPLDITDKDAVESICSDYSIDCIVNCAAYTNVDKAEDEEKLAYRINAYAVGLLAEAAAAEERC